MEPVVPPCCYVRTPRKQHLGGVVDAPFVVGDIRVGGGGPYTSCGNVVTTELHYASRKEGLQGPPSHEDIFWYKSDGAHHLNALTDLGSSEPAMIEAF